MITESTYKFYSVFDSKSIQNWTWFHTFLFTPLAWILNVKKSSCLMWHFLFFTDKFQFYVTSQVAQQWRICLPMQNRICRFHPSVGKIPWRKWRSTPVFLPEKFHAQRSLAGYSPWGQKESDQARTNFMNQILNLWFFFLNQKYYQELPGSPVVRALRSHCRGSILGQELRSHKPQGMAK